MGAWQEKGLDGRRIDALDELRGLAIAAVVLSHVGLVFYDDLPFAQVLAAPALGVGVDLFFVISGFVIVGSFRRLLSTVGGGFWRAAAAFWIRRSVRIAVPAWGVVAALGVVEASGGRLGATVGDLAAAAGFYANLHWAPCFAGRDGCGAAAAASHFWSLASEMQFYAAAPLIASLTLGQARMATIVILALGAAVERPWGDFLWTFRPDGLVIGALLAHELGAPGSWVRRVPTLGAGVSSLWLLGAAVLARVSTAIGGSGAGLVAIAIMFGAIVAGAAADTGSNDNAFRRLSAALGRLSFSLYLVHLPVLLVARNLLVGVAPAAIAVVTAIAMTAIAAILLEGLVTMPARTCARRWSARICERGERKDVASEMV